MYLSIPSNDSYCCCASRKTSRQYRRQRIISGVPSFCTFSSLLFISVTRLCVQICHYLLMKIQTSPHLFGHPPKNKKPPSAFLPRDPLLPIQHTGMSSGVQIHRGRELLQSPLRSVEYSISWCELQCACTGSCASTPPPPP